MKRILCLLLLSQAVSIHAAKKVNISKLKDELSKQSSQVIKLGAQIKSIEKKLGSTNDSYMDKTRALKQLDQKVIDLKNHLSQSALDISNSYKSSKKVLNQYLLDTIDHNNQDELLKKKIYLKILQKKITKLNYAQNKSRDLLAAINDYEEQLKATRINEETLYHLILKLERQKKNLGQNYIASMESKNELEEQLELAVARLKVKRGKKRTLKKVKHSKVKISQRFSNPLKEYISLKGSKKGVTYKYNKVSAVTSSQSGQVVYAGELASYGKVIMIDHGKDIRSVILGDINIKIKKGDFVKSNSVLGYANVDPGLTKSLYYEIRKNNKVQNTLRLLKTKKI